MRHRIFDVFESSRHFVHQFREILGFISGGAYNRANSLAKRHKKLRPGPLNPAADL